MAGHYTFCDNLTSLAPLIDLRPSSQLRTGALSTSERFEQLLKSTCLATYDASWPATHWPAASTDFLALPQPALAVNGRLAIPPPDLHLLSVGDYITEEGTGRFIAGVLPAADNQSLADIASGTGAGGCTRLVREEPAAHILTRPWHIRALRDKCLAIDLALLIQRIPPAAPHPAVTVILKEGTAGLHVHPTARIYPATIFNCESGPIVIDEHATVMPGAQLIGPCYIGPHSTILEIATIRPQTSVGPSCKVNGEVSGTIFQGFSNKAHDGFVGDSYLGEWVNLGAGTTTSNLLNTYGEITARQSAALGNERTGLTFLGSIIGDHTKTAICTRLMTGTIIHTGAMIASSAPASGCIPPFAWITDAGQRLYRLEKFLEVMRSAMQRRKCEPAADLIHRIKVLHAAASGEDPRS